MTSLMFCPKAKYGFTLLETILAVGLSALLIGLVGAGMRIYTKTVAERRADVVNTQLAHVLLQRIADDLWGTFCIQKDSSGAGAADDGTSGGDLGGQGDTGGDTSEIAETTEDVTADLTGNTVQPTPGLYGNPTELQIDVLGNFPDPIKFDTLAAMGIDPQAANLLSDPKVITYFLRPIDPSELDGTPLQSFGQSSDGRQTVLVRRVNSRAEAVYASSSGGAIEQAGEQLLSDQVVSLQFMYHDGFDWVDSWDSSLVGGLPIAVNITISIVNETAMDNTDLGAQTTDNVFQLTVRLPTAEVPEEDLSTMGLSP